jgi:single-strand DNA-binding protein
MQDNTMTLVGNLTDEPEVRFTSGVMATRCSCAGTVWQQSAENLADSLTKGTRVIVSGRLRQRSFETREGGKRTTVELVVDEVGVSLRYATVQITKTIRTSTSHE